MEQLELPFEYKEKYYGFKNCINGLIDSTIKLGAFSREAFPAESVYSNRQYHLNLTGVLSDRDFKDFDEMLIDEDELSDTDRKELLMNGFQYRRNLWVEEADSSRGARG